MKVSCAVVALIAAATGAAAADNSSSSGSNFVWPASIPKLKSTQYVMPAYDLSTLPKFQWSLANETAQIRQSICGMQLDYCTKAGCDADKDAKETKVADNFCDMETLASKCTCSGGSSRLMQYQWPVSQQDCRFRGQACRNQCVYGGGNPSAQPACLAACSNTFGMNCGMPGQLAANYAVNKKGEKPSLALTQGGNPQTGAALANMQLPARSTISAAALAVAGVAYALV